MKTEDKIKEYVEIEKRKREIRESLSLDEDIDLFYALTNAGIEP